MTNYQDNNIERIEEVENEQGINIEIIHEKPLKTRKSKRRRLFKLSAYMTVFFVVMFMVFSSQVLISKHDSDSNWFANLPIIKQIKNLAESADRSLKGETDDRINILLLGMGGLAHEGGNLTDTVMLASLKPSEAKVALTSIPRDMEVLIEGRGWQKINSVNAYAEMAEEGSGSLAASQAVSDILQTPIDYYVKVDFNGFIDIVDELGGVDVMVENTLDDYSYPIRGREEAEDYESRFEHLHVDKGLQHMDGELALKFARSRHGINGEGSDFARARRQQLVIEAIKEKALSVKNLFNPSVLAGIIGTINEHIDTNLKIWEMVKLWDMFKDIQRDDIVNKVLDDSPSGLLVGGRNDAGAYVLTPRSGDFQEIQYFVENIFTNAPEQIKTKVSEQQAKVEIRNGTWINGLASQSALEVERYGFVVTKIGNASKQNFETSVIYDLTYGEKMDSLTILKEKTEANISFGLPEWLMEDIESEISEDEDPIQPDFILILGQNADKSHSGTANLEK